MLKFACFEYIYILLLHHPGYPSKEKIVFHVDRPWLVPTFEIRSESLFSCLALHKLIKRLKQLGVKFCIGNNWNGKQRKGRFHTHTIQWLSNILHHPWSKVRDLSLYMCVMENTDHVYEWNDEMDCFPEKRRFVSWWEIHILKVCGNCSGKIACDVYTSTFHSHPMTPFYPQHESLFLRKESERFPLLCNSLFGPIFPLGSM